MSERKRLDPTTYTFIQVQDAVDCNAEVVINLSEKEKIVKSDLWVSSTFRGISKELLRHSFICLAVALKIRKI